MQIDDDPPMSESEEILRRYGIARGEDAKATLQGIVGALLRYRMANEAPGWKYNGNFSLGEHLSDAEVAGRVRMLTRNALDHEGVCEMARDRIRDLSRALGRANGRLAALGQDPEAVTSEKV